MQIELNRNYYKLVGNIPFMEKMCVCLFNYSPPEGNKASRKANIFDETDDEKEKPKEQEQPRFKFGSTKDPDDAPLVTPMPKRKSANTQSQPLQKDEPTQSKESKVEPPVIEKEKAEQPEDSDPEPNAPDIDDYPKIKDYNNKMDEWKILKDQWQERKRQKTEKAEKDQPKKEKMSDN